MKVNDGESNQDVELNLAPIIDCFTVLITYLLVTASFLTLSAIEVGVSATGTGAPPPDNAPIPMVMTLEVKMNGDIAIKIRGGADNKEIDLAVHALEAGRSNLPDLETRLQEVVNKWPAVTEVSVSAESSVMYKDIVAVIHKVQDTLPKVYISG